ncbi:MAG: MqnA/MqnD/SBP family protein [Bacteroidia bacterium]|nr:radical SAM protein [Bacteroidia bacterium]MDW8333969.1 MqnA/MqnD/SBP family protein [Bacteroidia bacterium]
MKKIVAVSYLNTRPFADGISRNFDGTEYVLETHPPSRCAAIFAAEKADVALIPVAALLDPDFNATVQDRYCIGARGKVDSVYVFSDVPIEQIETLTLDGDSRTSNALTQLLAREWWQIRPQILPAGVFTARRRYAFVSIGDKAIPLKDQYPYAYDLAAEWADYTAAKHGERLPFVFALWAHRKLDERWLERWYAALEDGVSRAAESAHRWAASYGMTPEKAEYYLTRSIEYRFDESMARALALFLEWNRVRV